MSTTLERLLSPLSLEEFFSEFWEKKVLYIPRDSPGFYDDLITFEEVGEYLARTDLRYPYVRLVQSGGELPLDRYAYDMTFGENLFQGNLDPDRVFSLYQEGATLCMQLQHIAMPGLRAFGDHVERLFGFKTQSTLFLTPPASQGFTAHFDTHDFFVFQVYGKKKWRIYEETAELPLARNRVLDSDVEISPKLALEPVLSPGDVLYVPRGVYHEALTNEGTSLQVSFGVFPFLWVDVLRAMVDSAADADVAFREVVLNPRGNTVGLERRVQELLALVARHASPSTIVQQMTKRVLSQQSKDCASRLLDLEHVDALNSSSLIERRNLYTSLECRGERVVLAFYDKELTFPKSLVDELEYLRSSDTAFRLGDIPGQLDAPGRLELTKLLVVEGLLRIARS